ncbi:hypothetical protein ACQR0Z_28660 [Bradyrhizobium sp. HKCCYLS3077]|uniref:hypothetical protein n=1 Tax=Bradyrhizobium sp. HKCCYLS3077 TaxID=3420761 RepID=UPI003EBBDEB6
MLAVLRSNKWLRAFCRFASLLGYGGALAIYHHAQPMAAKAYNDLCAGQSMIFYGATPIIWLGVALLVAGVPAVLVRGAVSLVLNLVLGLVALRAGISLLGTAGQPPYECFTQAGTYEDNVSGLGDFELLSTLLVLLSYVLLVAELVIRMRRRFIARRISATTSGLVLTPPRS